MGNVKFNDSISDNADLDFDNMKGVSVEELFEKYSQSKDLSNYELIKMETDSNSGSSKLFNSIKKFIKKLFRQA